MTPRMASERNARKNGASEGHDVSLSISVEIQASGVTALGILFAVLSGHAMLMRPFRA